MGNFEVCIRAIIFHQNKILICLHREKGYYFFPGGHLNFGESVKDALFREVKEELNATVKKYSFIGVIDNIYEEQKQKHHQINLVFHIIVDKIYGKKEIEETKKNHIAFIFFNIKRFKKEKVLPIALQKAILKWQKNKKFFWASQIYEKINQF